MRYVISRTALDRIIAADAASPEAEVCGLLLGHDTDIAEARPCRNVAATPQDSFEIDPAALIAAHRDSRGGGPAVIGHYHSHPRGRAEPSLRDAADAADDGALWLIVARGRARGWQAVRDGAVHSRFDAVDLVVASPCAEESAASQGPHVSDWGAGMSVVSPIDFASLLCSRLCHDLLSPVGALNNGLELMADETDPAMRQRCMELLSESARTSANKLKFFRLAFGAAGGFGETIDTREARIAIEGLFGEAKRVTPTWMVEDEQLPKPAIKALLNLALIAGDALVRGGQLDIGGESHDGQVEIVIRAAGTRVILDPELRRMLTEGPGEEPVTARAAAAYLVHALVSEGGGSVQVSEPGDGVLLFGAVLGAGPVAG